MKRILSLALMALLILSAAGCCPKDSGNPEEAAAYALAARVLPDHASRFVFEAAPAEAADFFTIESRGRKIVIGGNNANSMAVGLNHYLKYWCHVEYGWLAGDTFRMPENLPLVESPVKVSARVDKRFFLNYCTYGYTMPWWTWEDWEHFIDWMALNGINLPLAITGQESIWYQIWTEMGLSPEEVRAYFTGPAHLPWHRMQNIDRWGGPLPESWLDGQLELQKQITARERELNMKPVLPAFAGHVPRELARIYPDAPMTQLDAWAGYQDEYACTFLDPMSDLYCEIQKRFVEKESEIYGTDHIYGIDLFNELTPPSWEPEYLGRVSRQVYESLKAADPEATWLQMGWLFYNEREDWTNERVEAYLTSFPAEDQILLDYYCDRQEVWQRTEKFFGVPYIWCYLGNFGGNTFLAGKLDLIDERIENTFANGGGNFAGIGSTLEGFDCNPFVYEYVFEKAWDFDTHHNLPAWVEALADQRVGKVDENGRAAWKLLIDSIYTAETRPGQTPFVNARPSFGRAKTYYGNTRYSYSNGVLLQAVELLLKADGSNNAYAFDLVNYTRQLLSNYFGDLKVRYEEVCEAADLEKARAISEEMLGVVDDIDRLIGTQNYFLMGKWNADARSWGVTPEEKDYFERNARNLLTTWSDGDMLLNDYAARTWNGLTGTMYRVRWEMFFKAVDACLASGEKWDDAHYALYHKEVTAFEKSWWADLLGEFPATPQGDSKAVTAELIEKYRGRI